MYHTISDVLSLVNVMHSKATIVQQLITKENDNKAEIDILMSDIGYMAILLATEFKNAQESKKWAGVKSLGEN